MSETKTAYITDPDRWAMPLNDVQRKSHYFPTGTWDALCGQVWLAPSQRGNLAQMPTRDLCFHCEGALLKQQREAGNA